MIEPHSWKNPNNHFLYALNSEWYKLLAQLENTISYETMKFYEKKKIITIHLPVTTSSISSPMGRGSDSTPVKVNHQQKRQDLYIIYNVYYKRQYLQ